MNKNEILQEIADDMKRIFQEYYFKPFKCKENEQQAIKELAKQYLDSIKERLSANGYTIKTVKLPRKLKKYYKKTVGILPIEISIYYQLESLEIEVEK